MADEGDTQTPAPCYRAVRTKCGERVLGGERSRSTNLLVALGRKLVLRSCRPRGEELVLSSNMLEQKWKDPLRTPRVPKRRGVGQHSDMMWAGFEVRPAGRVAGTIPVCANRGQHEQKTIPMCAVPAQASELGRIGSVDPPAPPAP